MSAKTDKMLEEIDALTVVELSELVKGIEEKYGVTAAAVAAPAGAGAAAGDAGAEKSSFNVILKDGGAAKLQVIKVVREVNPNWGLKDANDLVDGAPKTVAEGVSKEDAEAMKAKFEEAGATVELQ